MSPQGDLQKFADKLAKAGREGVAWERKKLELILVKEKQDSKA